MTSPRKESPSPLQGEGWGEGEHPRNLALTDNAQSLRKRMTEVEKTLWYYLRDRRFEGLKFRRQYPLGKFIVDFICVEKKLIIELDGGQHAINANRDLMRDIWLGEQGYHVVRFWNNEVIENLNGVLETLHSYLNNPHPNPLPNREKGKQKLVDPRIDFERRDI